MNSSLEEQKENLLTPNPYLTSNLNPSSNSLGDTYNTRESTDGPLQIRRVPSDDIQYEADDS